MVNSQQKDRQQPRTGKNGNRNHNHVRGFGPGFDRTKLRSANNGSNASGSTPGDDVAGSDRGNRYTSATNPAGITKNRHTINPTQTAISQAAGTRGMNIVKALRMNHMRTSNTSTGSNNEPANKSNGTSAVSNQIQPDTYEPDYNDMHEFKQNNGVTEKVTAANGRVRPSRAATSGTTADSTHHGKPCEVCMSENHCLAQCIFAPRGYIFGCPMCNLRTHQVDHCDEYKKLSMEEKVKLLISDRASLPSLLTDEPWDDLLWNYLQRDNAVVPTGYPWSEAFSREESCKDSCRAWIRIQEAYDKDGNKEHLPFDVDTQDLKAIYETYWKAKNFQWNSRMSGLAAARPADGALQLRDDLPRCGNCLSTTHSLDRCLKATRGTISGCPLCKVPGHLLKDCDKLPLANADPSTIVRLLVWDRGNMPAWETKVPWFKYLYFYMSTFEFFLQDRKFVQSAPLPWTETYARAVAASASTQQNNGGIGSNLSDPQTANLAAAWKTFANPNEYVWPFGPSTNPFRQAEA